MDNTSLLIFLGIVPIVIILVIVYANDKNKEPLKLLFKLFLLGIISCLVVALITEISPPLDDIIKNDVLRLLFYAFIKVALLEELFKWIMVYFFGYLNKEFDEVYDIIVYSVFVSLGFAFLENMIFILSGGKLSSILIRAVLSIPGHTSFAIFMGYYLCIARMNKKIGKHSFIYMIMSLIIPILIHGIYDYCLMANLREFIYIFVMFIISLYIITYYKLKSILDIDKSIKLKSKYCLECGSRIVNNVCIKCGKRIQ